MWWWIFLDASLARLYLWWSVFLVCSCRVVESFGCWLLLTTTAVRWCGCRPPEVNLPCTLCLSTATGALSYICCWLLMTFLSFSWRRRWCGGVCATGSKSYGLHATLAGVFGLVADAGGDGSGVDCSRGVPADALDWRRLVRILW